MEPNTTFEKITLPACDQIIASLSAQRAPLSRLGRLHREIEFWRKVRHAKARQDLTRGGEAITRSIRAVPAARQ